MPTYSYQRPVKITANGRDEKYKADHLKHFIKTVIYPNILSFSEEDKEKYFKFHRDYGVLLMKIYGDSVELFGEKYFLAEASKNNIDDVLVNQYKEWLEKQDE